jgi:hypothetical protein
VTQKLKEKEKAKRQACLYTHIHKDAPAVEVELPEEKKKKTCSGSTRLCFQKIQLLRCKKVTLLGLLYISIRSLLHPN